MTDLASRIDPTARIDYRCGSVPCRAMATYEVAETVMRSRWSDVPTGYGYWPIGSYCEGHAISWCRQGNRRVMRPLAATFETRGKP